MKKTKLLKISLIFSILFLLLFPVVVFAAPTAAECQGPISSRPVDCPPPSLGDFQTSLVSLIGTAYAMTGLLFMGILIFNGMIYLVGYIEDAKYILGASIEDAQKRMTQWLIGFLMIMLSYPLINGFMQLIVGTNECYSKLNNPTVQFIFPTVCKLADGASSTSTSTDPPQDAASCSSYNTTIQQETGQGINVWCTGRCAGLTEPKPKFMDFPYPTTGTLKATIKCNCTEPSPSCWSVG